MQALGVAAFQAPLSMALVLAAELVAEGRIAAGCGPITHCGQLGPGEQRWLPHKEIISHGRTAPSVLDHAKVQEFCLLHNGGWVDYLAVEQCVMSGQHVGDDLFVGTRWWVAPTPDSLR
jgi:hypothetical protein